LLESEFWPQTSINDTYLSREIAVHCYSYFLPWTKPRHYSELECVQASSANVQLRSDIREFGHLTVESSARVVRGKHHAMSDMTEACSPRILASCQTLAVGAGNIQ
jgi:hypothetical protein